MKILQGIRPLTLPLSITPVLIGGFAALESIRSSRIRFVKALCVSGDMACRYTHYVHEKLSTFFFLMWALCLVVALFLQIAANFANDYSDGMRGVDASRADDAQAAPDDGTLGHHDHDIHLAPSSASQSASGPSRLVASGTDPMRVLMASIVSAVLACDAGLAIVMLTRQWWLMAVGALCLLAGWFYVGGKHPYGYRGLGGAAVFVFFGLVATLGTEYVLVSRITAMGVCGAVSAGASACVVLGVNNMRDLRSDAAAGKRTLTVILGRRAASALMLGELLVSMVALCAAVMILKSPLGICGALLAFSIAVVCVNDVWNCGSPDVSDDELASVVDFRAMFHHAIGFSVVLTIGYALCITIL